MKNRRHTMIGAVLLGILLCISTAQAEPEFKEKQFYLGLGLGVSNLDPETSGTSRVDDAHDLGIKVFAGYDFTNRLSLEGYYADLGETDITSPSGTIEYKSFGAAALYYFYKQNEPHVGWDAFGRLGLGHLKNSSNLNIVVDNKNHIMFGAGIEYGFYNGFALRADIDLYDKDANLYGLYLLKRFGGKPIKSAESLDNDGDGVLNSEDACPNTPLGTAVDRKGCERDDDGDSIVNSKDRCPETPIGEKVDSKGCKLEDVIVLEDVTFATDSAELISHSKQALNEIRDTLNRHPELIIEVAGHTDKRGTRKYNLDLSQGRAETVRNYLIEQGIAEDRITAKGYGFDKPISDDETEEGLLANRRVEVHILN